MGEPRFPVSSFRFLRPLEAHSRKRAEQTRNLGGKAAWLARVMNHDLPVPKTWVLDVKAFRELALARLPPGHDPHALLRMRAGHDLIERAARARALLVAESLPGELVADLAALWASVESEAPWGLAVRSSATCEDDDMTSMAGLATSELGVRGARELGASLRRVWASAFLPRALMYLAARGVRDLEMAVIFQIVVPADAAGVAFTAPPPGVPAALFQSGEMLVNAAFGLGSPVVDGAVTPDVARIDRATGAVVEYRSAEKRRALVVGAHGLEAIDVDPSRALAPALDAAMLARLAEYARILESEAKGPLDLEFAVHEGQLWIVQARRALGAGFPEGGDAETVWSRANVGEALPGAATPLTWSVAQSFCERGFRKAFASLGCSVPRAAHLVANVHGRFYLNLTEFMRIAAQVPGLDPKTLIEVGGGAQMEILEKQVAHISKRPFYARLPVTLARLLSEQMRLAGDVDRYEVQAARIHRNMTEIDLAILPDGALATTLRDARRLLDRCGELALACASASLASHLALKTVVAHSLPADAERIAQLLSSGVGDLVSALPGLALSRVADVAREDASARRMLEAGTARAVSDLPDGPTRHALEQFLAAYGDRAVREAELSAPRWREDTTQVLAMLRSALRAPAPSPSIGVETARVRRDRELETLKQTLSLPEMSFVRVLVARAQKFVRLRERMRAWVTRVLGLVRTAALEVDRRLLRLDPALEPGAAFFCTLDELITMLEGGTRVGELVRTRRAESARDRARPDPPVTFVGCPPPLVLPPQGDGGAMTGLPASGGIVEGVARVLDAGGSDADQLVAGEILVARTTDVGLSPLFLIAAGIVTELGGPLSHAALIAREYGVPAVVNVQGVMIAIRTGDRVRVNGDQGTVERLASS
jgi:phosphohistidine swiveling domain-containing protein